MFAWLFSDTFLMVVLWLSSDGKASTDSIRQDLGMRLMWNTCHQACWLEFVVALHHELNEINKMKRLLLSFTFCCRDRQYPLGDQLRQDVQHWLSPPDPSTNQNFVRKARHSGTAAWFFKSNELTEWKSTGSLLWIHGKRTFCDSTTTALN